MESKTFGWNYTRLTLQLLLILGIVVAGVLAELDSTVPSFLRALGTVVAIIFGILMILQLPTIFSKEPGLVLGANGLQVPNTFSGIIPWSKITKVIRTKTGRTDFLGVTIDETYSESIRWVGLIALMGRHPKSFSIAVKNYDASPNQVVQSIAEAWDKGKQVALASGEALAETPIEQTQTLVATKFPVATYTLIVLFLIVYACELFFAVNPNKAGSPTTLTLAYLGGDMGNRVQKSGEYWRMFTAPLMHASPLHIGLNILVFWWAGKTLERIAGWKWLLGIFAITALGGEIASNLFLAPNIIGVGASGGIMGVLAAVMVSAGRLLSSASTAAVINAARWLIPSLIPHSFGGNTNYYAHGGGALVGAILGFVLLKLWKNDTPKPPFAGAMAMIAMGYFAVAAYAIYPIMNLYHR